jgi:uncharacterized Zn-binding protein involved in type VI secretion
MAGNKTNDRKIGKCFFSVPLLACPAVRKTRLDKPTVAPESNRNFNSRKQERKNNMPPAARISDMHVCPLATPGTPPIPHVGGPISAGCPTVIIGGMPAARVGDIAICVGPPDAVAMGSNTVMIGGMPAARLGDMTVHGGAITVGFPQVMIG